MYTSLFVLNYSAFSSSSLPPYCNICCIALTRSPSLLSINPRCVPRSTTLPNHKNHFRLPHCMQPMRNRQHRRPPPRHPIQPLPQHRLAHHIQRARPLAQQQQPQPPDQRPRDSPRALPLPARKPATRRRRSSSAPYPRGSPRERARRARRPAGRQAGLLDLGPRRFVAPGRAPSPTWKAVLLEKRGWVLWGERDFRRGRGAGRRGGWG